MLRFAPVLLLLLSACSVAGPSDADIDDARSPEAEGVVVNRSGADFVPFAVDAELAAVINFAGEIAEVDPETVVRRGEAAPLSVGGFREGEDFIVYLLRVRGSSAVLDGSVTVDADDFRRNDEVVTVRRF